MFYLIFLHGNVYKENEQNPSEPTTKESYDMPKTQVQTPNRFEVLGKIPKPSIPSFSTPVYQTK